MKAVGNRGRLLCWIEIHPNNEKSPQRLKWSNGWGHFSLLDEISI